MIQHHTYTTHSGNEIRLTAYSTENLNAPLVLYVHGFKGFKDWGFVPYLGEKFVEAGMNFLCFNFSHNGVKGDEQDISDLEAFAQNTYSLELSELSELIEQAHAHQLINFSPKSLGLLGHSRGGGIAILAAALHPEVQALSTWAAISTVERYDKKTRQEWKEKGYLEVKNLRTGQIFTLGRAMLEDIEKNGNKYLHILQAAQNLSQPWQIIHGDKDEAVPFFEAEQLRIFSKAPLTDYQLIPDTGHTFAAAHPFTDTNPILESVIAKTINFFQKFLV